MTYFYKYCFD